MADQSPFSAGPARSFRGRFHRVTLGLLLWGIWECTGCWGSGGVQDEERRPSGNQKTYNLHKDKQATPYGVGYRQQHGLQVRGGSDAVRCFLHGEWEDEDGVTKIPEFDQRYLAARGISLRPEQRDPNALRRVTARANISIAARDNLDIGINTGYITQDLRLPRSDDSGTARPATRLA